MTYDQYWHGSPGLVIAYAEAHRLLTERRNFELWMQGAYIFEAASAAVYNSLRTKGPPEKYREKPIRITPLSKKEKEEESRKAWEIIKSKLNAIKESFDTRSQGEVATDNGDTS